MWLITVSRQSRHRRLNDKPSARLPLLPQSITAIRPVPDFTIW